MYESLKVNVPQIGYISLRSAFAARRMWTTHLEEALELDRSPKEIAILQNLLDLLDDEITRVVGRARHLNLDDRRLLKLEGWAVGQYRRDWRNNFPTN